MKDLSLYVENDSAIHTLNTITKFVYVMTAIIVPICIGSLPAFYITLAISILLLTIGKVLKEGLTTLLVVGMIVITMVIIQGLVHPANETIAFKIGFLTFYQEGLFSALRLIINVFNIVLAFAVLILTTTPSEMTDALIQLKFPPTAAYVFGSVFQILPQMLQTVQTITDAQKSRGVEMTGNIFIRIKAFFPLISPVIMNSLVMTKERAIALEVRGFGFKGMKTNLYQTKNTMLDNIIIVVLLIILLGAMGWRIYIWLS